MKGVNDVECNVQCHDMWYLMCLITFC